MKTILKSLFFISFFIVYSATFAQESRIIVRHKFNKEDRSIVFSYEKNIPGTYTLRLEFTVLENAYDPFFHGVIDDNRGILFSLKPIDRRRRIKFSYRYSDILGRITPPADSMFVYLLPFRKGSQVKPHELSYVWKKILNKVPPKNWESFLFRSDKPDMIYAVRKGTVVQVRTENAPDSLYTNYHSNANTILVEHADGTIASYNGLAQNGSFVKEGDIVYPQTPLGVLGYYDAKKDYQLRFSILHLIEEDSPKDKLATIKDRKCYYEYIHPYFLTGNGITRLSKNKRYTAAVNEKALTAEMTQKEKINLQAEITALANK